ncbi:MAG: energy transducer TonB [Ghiorsea sp.]
MTFPKVWLQAIVLGLAMNFALFLSLTTLSKKEALAPTKILTVDFMAWQEPKKVTQAPRKPLKKVKPQPKKKPKAKVKKKNIKKPELSIKEPIKIPQEIIEDTPDVVEEVIEEVLPTPVPIFEVSALPRFVHRSNPVYPPSMKRQGKEGVVMIEALVDATGKVRKVYVVESAGELFDQAAISAIQGSTFIPANTNGKPVPVLLRVPIRFRLR